MQFNIKHVDTVVADGMHKLEIKTTTGHTFNLERVAVGWDVHLVISIDGHQWHNQEATESDKTMWSELYEIAFTQRDNTMNDNRKHRNIIAKQLFTL